MAEVRSIQIRFTVLDFQAAMLSFPNARLLIPPFVRPAIKKLLRLVPSRFKYPDEIGYWQNEWAAGRFHNDYYERTMLTLAHEPDGEFLRDKIVADFGCGPQGSLCWAKLARARIGIDVLADAYSQFGIRGHDMIYVSSTEHHIPLPSNYVDVMFTMNAMDHVSSFSKMAAEVVRVIAPGGLFIGAFNLGEPPTFSEPQTLTEDRVRKTLLGHLNIELVRSTANGPDGDKYRHIREGGGSFHQDIYLFCLRARKPLGP
jgi:SAM-dependent methyltransferase